MRAGRTSEAIDLNVAKASYREAGEIADRLAKSDPGNAGWQRGLSVSHDKLGRVMEALGRKEDAMAHYEKDLEIAERLARMDPGNAVWRKDAEISRARMRRLGR